MNSLCVSHFMEENRRFNEPVKNYRIIKVLRITLETKLTEELEELKEWEKGLNTLMNIKTNFENE